MLRTPPRILFVDDNHLILKVLRRVIGKRRQDWDCEYVLSGELAIQAFEERPFDLIASDLLMPGMDGAALLQTVADRWPTAIRFLISGVEEFNCAPNRLQYAQHVSSKPIDPNRLMAQLEQALQADSSIFDSSPSCEP